jgi:hypothetical protein
MLLTSGKVSFRELMLLASETSPRVDALQAQRVDAPSFKNKKTERISMHMFFGMGRKAYV